MNAHLTRWESATDGTFGREFISALSCPERWLLRCDPFSWILSTVRF